MAYVCEMDRAVESRRRSWIIKDSIVITEMSQNSSLPVPPLVTLPRSKSRRVMDDQLLPVEIIMSSADSVRRFTLGVLGQVNRDDKHPS